MGLCLSVPYVLDPDTGADIVNPKDFFIQSMINEGGYGTVFRAINKHNGEKSAFKFFGYTENNPLEDEIDDEIKLMMSLRGIKGVIQLKGVFKDSKTGLVEDKKFLHPYKVISMELAEGGDLYDRIIERSGKISEKYLAKSFKSAIEALLHIHQAGFLHRDIKPENIIAISSADDSELKIIDFGMMLSLNGRSFLIDENRSGTPSM